MRLDFESLKSWKEVWWFLVTFVLCLTENKIEQNFYFFFVSFLRMSLETLTKVLLLLACSRPHLQHSLSEFCQRITTVHSVWEWTCLVVEIVSAAYFIRLTIIFINYFTRQTCNNSLICYWVPAHFEFSSSGCSQSIKVACVDLLSLYIFQKYIPRIVNVMMHCTALLMSCNSRDYDQQIKYVPVSWDFIY